MAKADSLATQAVADGVLYDAGFADGVASVQVSGISQSQEQADIAAAVKAATDPLSTQISTLQLAKSQEDALLASVQASVQALVSLLAPKT